MNNDGSNVVRLTKDYKSDNSWPIWSPDGTSIIFANIDDYDNNRPFAEIKTTFANFAFLLATFARFSPKNVNLSRSFCEFLIFWIRSKK